ncbi:hypothetical protein Hanom_Chr17g01588991 [Helianthus anomalus]
MRINGLQFSPTHSHDLSSNPPYAKHTMYKRIRNYCNIYSTPATRLNLPSHAG